VFYLTQCSLVGLSSISYVVTESLLRVNVHVGVDLIVVVVLDRCWSALSTLRMNHFGWLKHLWWNFVPKEDFVETCVLELFWNVGKAHIEAHDLGSFNANNLVARVLCHQVTYSVDNIRILVNYALHEGIVAQDSLHCFESIGD